MRVRVLAFLALLLCVPLPARAGGPAYVAGSGYDPGVKGQPIVWAGNYVEYFTDQGDLSPILTNAQADAFVANAFSPWTSVLDSAFTASQGGHLAEDVNATNVIGYPTVPTRFRLTFSRRRRRRRSELFTTTTARSPMRCWARVLEGWTTVSLTPYTAGRIT